MVYSALFTNAFKAFELQKMFTQKFSNLAMAFGCFLKWLISITVCKIQKLSALPTPNFSVAVKAVGTANPFKHSWASASRPMPPAAVFRHPTSQSGTVAFRYRTGIPLFRYRTVRHSGI
jgi:hypothetical protein